jgi:phosphoribosyl 1,2-cyclic phosphodiesterase
MMPENLCNCVAAMVPTALGVLTDLGHGSDHVVQALQACQALLLECNHDSELLAQSAYPPFLKKRISGPLGHLSNAESAKLATALHHSGLKLLVAAHLSERNNRPDMAQAVLSHALGCAANDIPGGRSFRGNLLVYGSLNHFGKTGFKRTTA